MGGITALCWKEGVGYRRASVLNFLLKNLPGCPIFFKYSIRDDLMMASNNKNSF